MRKFYSLVVRNPKKLLALFALLLFSVIRIAIKCDSLFYRLACVGFVGLWMFQIFENIGMCIGLMPITGIPLPFISFGSSSMIVQCMIIGIVLSREKIEDHIWNYDYSGGSNVVDVYISYLRKKIDGGQEKKLIRTVWGSGWTIKEDA